MAEDEFWRAYFYRCACLRAAVGMNTTATTTPGGAAGESSSLNYPLIGEPVSVPSVVGGGAARAEGAAATVGGAESAATAAAPEASGAAVAEKGQGEEEAKAAASSLATWKGEGKGVGGGGVVAEEDDDDFDGSLDLDGLDLGSDDGEEGAEGGLLEGDALKELEAQIAAELDAEGL